MSWWRYIAWALTAVIGVLAYVLVRRRSPRWPPSDSTTRWRDAVEQAQLDLAEAKQRAVVDVAAAQRDDQDLKRRLTDAVKESDATRRRQRMLALYREVGGW